MATVKRKPAINNHLPLQYRKRPVVIHALKFDWENHMAVGEFVGSAVEILNKALFIKTLEGRMECSPGDWIIKGVKGEFYPCKPDIFEKTYDEFVCRCNLAKCVCS